MKFVCKNEHCSRYGIEDDYVSATYKLLNDKLVASCAPCLECGQLRDEINDNELIPIDQKGVSIGTYASASPEQRREMLKKRAHDHYEKDVKPYKEHQLHKLVDDFKSIR